MTVSFFSTKKLQTKHQPKPKTITEASRSIQNPQGNNQNAQKHPRSIQNPHNNNPKPLKTSRPCTSPQNTKQGNLSSTHQKKIPLQNNPKNTYIILPNPNPRFVFPRCWCRCWCWNCHRFGHWTRSWIGHRCR